MSESPLVVGHARGVKGKPEPSRPDAIILPMVSKDKYDALLKAAREAEKALEANIAEWTADGEMTSRMRCVELAKAALRHLREHTGE